MKPECQEYEGHPIELREREGKPELLIDNVPVRYGQLPNGLYFMHDYAYDWTDNLMELAQRFINYRRKVATRSGANTSPTGGDVRYIAPPNTGMNPTRFARWLCRPVRQHFARRIEKEVMLYVVNA